MGLPALREELRLHPGPASADGAPTWTLQDPSGNRFFRIDWPTFLILSHWHAGSPAQVAAEASSHAPMALDSQDVEAVLDFLGRSELLQCTTAMDTRRLDLAARGRRRSAGSWLLHHYLFFRVPLWRPDPWLQRAAPLVAPFFSRHFAYLSLLALVLGILGVSRQWEHFRHTLVGSLDWNGAKAYLAVLIGVKILHEFGHAFTARRLGCRVPAMGVAFLVLWPVAYTDVNDAWKLPHRRDRLQVGAAGVLTELGIAAWATLAWTLLPDGTARNAAFLLATTTWITTLAVNASPFLRFDGYFLLSDWLDLPNLHARAFALARWKLREILFDLGEERPEVLPPARQRFMIVFAWITWLYRLVLFLGIALLVYHLFFKLLGLFLFAVEIAWFILMPLRSELGEWRQRWPAIRSRGRDRLWLGAAAAIVALGLLPLGFLIESQGMLKPERSLTLYSPGPARLTGPLPAHGTPIQAGAPLFALEAPELEARAQLASARAASLARQLEMAAVTPEKHADLPLLREEARRVAEEQEGIATERVRLAPLAPFDGVWLDPQPDLQPGDWVGKSTRLAVLADPSRWRVETYLEEQDLERVQVGNGGHFYPEAPGQPVLGLRVSAVERDATHTLGDPALASPNGGAILVRQHDQRLIPERAVFRVTLDVDGPPPASLSVLRGQVVVRGEGQSLLGRYFKAAVAVLVRESGW